MTARLSIAVDLSTSNDQNYDFGFSLGSVIIQRDIVVDGQNESIGPVSALHRMHEGGTDRILDANGRYYKHRFVLDRPCRLSCRQTWTGAVFDVGVVHTYIYRRASYVNLCCPSLSGVNHQGSHGIDRCESIVR